MDSEVTARMGTILLHDEDLYFVKLLSHSVMEPIVQLLKDNPAFYGTRTFITVFTRNFHWTLS
jgi:hypothetical protein